jgi:hypothetical protein
LLEELEGSLPRCENYLYCIKASGDNGAKIQKKGVREMVDRIGGITLMVLVVTWLFGIVLLCLSVM